MSNLDKHGNILANDFMDIEIFPCSGGLAEGHRQAGIHFDLAIEWMVDHCDSYEQNLGHRPMQMDARDFLQMLVDGWRPPKPVRYLCADPPCTPWSRAGKRMGEQDPRDMLWGTCEIIKLLKPQAYLIGNVPGLDDGPNLPIVQSRIGALSQHGYCTADFARLDAVNYGVPQHRVRPWWFGHLEGPCIQWPIPTHGDPAVHRDQLSVPGVAALIPWITCDQALSFLSDEERGRPIKLRRRASNSAQHGSVPERPARTVGTSNLSDGNVILGPEQPRAKKRGGKNHGTPQGRRTTDKDAPAPTVTRAIHHTIIADRPPNIPFGMREEIFGPPAPLELAVVEPKKSNYRKEDDHRVRQADRIGDARKPSPTITAKTPRARAGAHATIDASTFTIQDRRGGVSGLNTMDKPSKALVKNTHGNGSVIVTAHPGHLPNTGDRPSQTVTAKQRGVGAEILVSSKHPAVRGDGPATTIRGGGEGHSAPIVVVSSKHPGSRPDEPSLTVRATDGAGNSRALAWPWNRPSTTVLGDPRLAPPGHHDESYSIMNTDGEGIVISERAASILQGFPDTLACACPGWQGKKRIAPWERANYPEACATCGQMYELVLWTFSGATKKTRFSQLGQAMPPPFAYAVASSVMRQFEKVVLSKLQARINNENRSDPTNYKCTVCDQYMERWSDFEESQHQGSRGCGGLVTYVGPSQHITDLINDLKKDDFPVIDKARDDDQERSRLRELARGFEGA